jgi:hypothetical protein
MSNSKQEMREYLNLSRELFEKDKVFLLTESNVLDVYKKLVNKEEISDEELSEVQKRFFDLVNY